MQFISKQQQHKESIKSCHEHKISKPSFSLILARNPTMFSSESSQEKDLQVYHDRFEKRENRNFTS